MQPTVILARLVGGGASFLLFAFGRGIRAGIRPEGSRVEDVVGISAHLIAAAILFVVFFSWRRTRVRSLAPDSYGVLLPDAEARDPGFVLDAHLTRLTRCYSVAAGLIPLFLILLLST